MTMNSQPTLEFNVPTKTDAQHCFACGQSIAKQKIKFNRLMLQALIKAYIYAMDHDVKTVLIKNLPLTRSEYGMMSCLITFGLLYRSEGMKSGEYGIPFTRVYQFLHGAYTVAEYYLADPVRDLVEKHHQLSENRIYVHQVPTATDILATYGPKMTEYIPNDVQLAVDKSLV